ncbi:DNA polymerase III subunit delta [Desulfopila inferna]|uniref:DNA polymerase III subunit delta n=1 Tax=Desulfopila inferna TaxID=468528 RepID=UPI001964FA97|nr:DNA polymerase III subunit delta [Desulfopila inferna]MBM9603531.1 DNA polymerase III subunit delta [Desulfopila inferna]
MPLIKRSELDNALPSILVREGPRIFLFFGERFLCRKAVDELQHALLNWKNGIVCSIDGDREDIAQTLSKLMSFSLLPGLQLYRVNDTRLFHSKNISETVWRQTQDAYQANRLQQAAKYMGDMYHLASLAPEQRQPLSEMSDGQWQDLFGLAKPADLGWTDALFEIIREKDMAGPTATDLPEKFIQSFQKGLPPDNILILTAENVDKRKRLFTYIKEHGVIVDCSVAEGGAAAQRAQKFILQEMMEKTLARFNKTIEPGALEIFFERIGFHPVAVVTETEKLALYCGDRPKITLQDIKQMVGRSREDALFELTDHFGKRQLGKTLITLAHLLENGVHGLAILATMRNYVRKLLIFRIMQLQPEPPFRRGMNVKYFQENYLPQLKETGQWPDLLKGHPYALFMSFSKAQEFHCSTLKSWLEQILLAEFRLKGSGLPERLVLEQLMVALVKKTGVAQN